MISTINTDKEEKQNFSTKNNANNAEKNIYEEQLNWHRCHQCHRDFKTNRGLLNQRKCKGTLHITSNNAKIAARSDPERPDISDITSNILIQSPYTPSFKTGENIQENPRLDVNKRLDQFTWLFLSHERKTCPISRNSGN